MSSGTAPVVSIISVAHNAREGLLKGLAALRGGTEVPTEMIVVDNGSTDNTAAALRHAFREVTVVRRESPVHPLAAANLGAAHARAPWLLLLDPGLEPVGDAIRTLVEYAGGHPSYRLYTGRTLRMATSATPPQSGPTRGALPQGRPTHAGPTHGGPSRGAPVDDGLVDDGRTVEGPPSLWGTMCLAAGLPLDPERLPRLDRAIGGEVPVLTPRMLLVERGLWESLGGFDERLPAADLSVRARARGARPVLVPDARMVSRAPAGPDRQVTTARHAAPLTAAAARRSVTTADLAARMAFAHRHWPPARARAAGWMLSGAALIRSAAGDPWRSMWRDRAWWLSTADGPASVPAARAPQEAPEEGPRSPYEATRSPYDPPRRPAAQP